MKKSSCTPKVVGIFCAAALAFGFTVGAKAENFIGDGGRIAFETTGGADTFDFENSGKKKGKKKKEPKEKNSDKPKKVKKAKKEKAPKAPKATKAEKMKKQKKQKK